MQYNNNNNILIPEADDQSVQFFLNIVYDKKSAEQIVTAHGPPETLFNEKIKLSSEAENVDNVTGSFKTIITNQNGKIIKLEKTEVITVHKFSKEVENNIQLLRSVTEPPAILKKLLERTCTTEKVIVSEPTKQDDTPVKGKSRADSDNLVLKENKFEYRKLSGELESSPMNKLIPYLQKQSYEAVESTINTAQQLLQCMREQLDIPDETGKFSKIFSNAEEIGVGSYGKVFRVSHKLEEKIYAVKKVKLRLDENNKLNDSKVFREVKAMTNLHHPNIVRFGSLIA